ncbi:MAG: alpha-ketoglutarate-dependent dioxygenase AlkB [Acidimicrobiales bacterium]|nr:alpha-ketoglutarate-dependent dioxygenase AlkB [Acidimicrobiales bacterium]
MPGLTWQPSLLDNAEPQFHPTLGAARRRLLGSGAWVDLVPGWATGTGALFDQLLEEVEWAGRRRRMYERMVDEPRLHAARWGDKPDVLRRMSSALSHHYGRRLPSITANLYRDGNDSVAWHGDRVGRRSADTVVAILSLGSTRRFLLRPDGGGPSIRYDLHPGDLIVLGGTCQTTWEHCIPKRAQAGPRISVMFREPGVR